MSHVLKMKNASKVYKMGEVSIHALREVTIEVEQGEFVAVMGPSGSGKSTFLQIASILNAPSSGHIWCNGKEVGNYSEVEQAKLRNQEIGFVFQQFNLLARTTAVDNVALPLLYSNVSKNERTQRAIHLLEKVGLSDRLQNTPAQLSGGQQQRVAIARALINNPALIFADEPTGNLDSKSGEEIKQILSDLHDEGKTIIMVTHEEDVAMIAKRLVFFQDGEIFYDDKYGWNEHMIGNHSKEELDEVKRKIKLFKKQS